MMENNKYNFSTSYFGISGTGLHYLRSGYNYKTIPSKDILSAEITTGNVVHNSNLLLVISLMLIACSCYLLKGMFEFLISPNGGISLRLVFLILIVSTASLLCLYNSLKKGRILKVKFVEGSDFFVLEDGIDENELRYFIKENWSKNKLVAV